MDDVELFDAVGFRWDRDAVAGVSPPQPLSVQRVVWRFMRALPEFVWDAAQLEGNPFTYPEVQTLLEGITVGGHKISDERQVLNLAESSRRLAAVVTDRQFALAKEVSDELHTLIAAHEAPVDTSLPEWGRPAVTVPGGANLRHIYSTGLAAITAGIDSVFEQAVIYCLFACRNQFYFDGNKRTSRAMNGHLLAHGYDAISVPAARRPEYNTKMIDFYRLADATAMIAFFESFPGTESDRYAE